jgi:hypothetical protein
MLDQNISFMLFVCPVMMNKIYDVMPYFFLRNTVTTSLAQRLMIILLRE